MTEDISVADKLGSKVYTIHIKYSSERMLITLKILVMSVKIFHFIYQNFQLQSNSRISVERVDMLNKVWIC